MALRGQAAAYLKVCSAKNKTPPAEWQGVFCFQLM
ncbi:MAG: hypothetical protein ACI9VR_005422, partial [Cognaticolwellia sp.]